MTDGTHPREVSRLVISKNYASHWTALDPETGRIVVTSGQEGDRTYMLKLDQATGALSIDTLFRDQDAPRLQLCQSLMAARLDWRRQAARSSIF